MAVRQHRLRQSPKVLERRQQTPDQRRRLGARDKGHEPHTRVTQDRGEAEELAHLPLLLVEELAPVELELLARLGLIADDGA